jgi:hypothetical protein
LQAYILGNKATLLRFTVKFYYSANTNPIGY